MAEFKDKTQREITTREGRRASALAYIRGSGLYRARTAPGGRRKHRGILDEPIGSEYVSKLLDIKTTFLDSSQETTTKATIPADDEVDSPVASTAKESTLSPPNTPGAPNGRQSTANKSGGRRVTANRQMSRTSLASNAMQKKAASKKEDVASSCDDETDYEDEIAPNLSGFIQKLNEKHRGQNKKNHREKLGMGFTTSKRNKYGIASCFLTFHFSSILNILCRPRFWFCKKVILSSRPEQDRTSPSAVA